MITVEHYGQDEPDFPGGIAQIIARSREDAPAPIVIERLNVGEIQVRINTPRSAHEREELRRRPDGEDGILHAVARRIITLHSADPAKIELDLQELDPEGTDYRTALSAHATNTDPFRASFDFQDGPLCFMLRTPHFGRARFIFLQHGNPRDTPFRIFRIKGALADPTLIRYEEEPAPTSAP